MKPILQLILWFILLLSSLLKCTLAEVYSCGGFVKSPNAPIDYSKIQVKLLTAEGNLKYETECNPSNGYYMIPVYNKAAYSIRVFAPEGWFFEPGSVELKVDGKTDLCTLNEDINFVLSSFAVNGILRSGEGGGPAGVALILSNDSGKVIASTKTEANGAYSFRAPPGKYLVSTADGSAQCIERGKVPIEVVASPINVSPDLKISGHLLTVVARFVVKSLSGVSISLYSHNTVKLSYCKGVGTTKSQDGKKLVCLLKTDEDGVAKFPCLPPGNYEILPTLSTDKVQFTFSPKVFALEMGSAAQEVKFEMLGFSLRGRVLVGGAPIEGVDIIVDDVKKAKSDKDGWYTLEELKEREYRITGQKEHYQIDVLKVTFLAKSAAVPNLTAKKVEVCGSLDVEEAKNHVMTVFITNKRTKDPQSVRSNSNGKFCKMVEPDIYIVSVPSKETGVLMMPKQREIDASKGPVLDMVFTQFKANIFAKVSCIDSCDELKMELWSGKELVRSVAGTDQFRFMSVSPDTYKMKIVDGGRYCWEQSEIDFTIERSHIDDLTFRQKGYRASVRVTHPAKMKWQLAEKKQITGDMTVPAGVSSFCVPLAGRYNLNFDACYKFEKPSYELVVPQEIPLVVSASQFLASAFVSSDTQSVEQPDFVLQVKTSSGVSTIKGSPTSSDGKYEFSFYLSVADAGKKVVLVPQSSIYLFEPLSHEFAFSGECHENEVTFKADKGVFIEGTLSSPVEGVEIEAKHRTVKDYSLNTVTDANGSYRLGPVRNLKDFEIVAKKEGYKFEKGSKEEVIVPIKLSQLRILTVDALSGKPLGDVLLSLSGVQNYRSNSIIDQTGKLIFVGLHPGEYFIRPILQEYQFEPQSLTINVKEGEEETVTFKGRQFAYSVLGKVSHMAGQPVEAVVVEGVSEQCSQVQEEDTTSEKGTYRIRGLRPNCVYRVTLKSQDGKRIQSYPTFYDLSVIDKNIENVDFVLTSVERPMDVTGEVEFVGIKPPAQYRVALYKRDTLVQRSTVHAPSCIFFFDNLPVDGTEYSVRFEGDSSYAGEKYVSREISFVADATYKAVKLRVISQQKSSEVEISVGSYLALPFFLFIAFVFFNHQKALSFAETTFSRFSAIRHHSPSPPDDSGDGIRRRVKPRKL